MSTNPVSVRAIGRHAVREELARIAFNQFCATGFDQVTFADLAGATGVSRSTFLRYFANKEDVVLFVFDPIGDIVVDALASVHALHDDWLALRRAFDPVLSFLARDADEVIAFLNLIEATPALRAKFREKQFGWRPNITRELLRREQVSVERSIIADVRVATAMECFSTALIYWRDANGQQDLSGLLDLAFGALSDPGASAGPPDSSQY
ncbi:TetR/AcrR family transcriptional regulator [Agreia sp.]|uniref:TetR/AcrR family transcriptional regulator n=1 Tax=Agreia sp. TaxID=1872416 RepID=UPI0035BC5EA7